MQMIYDCVIGLAENFCRCIALEGLSSVVFLSIFVTAGKNQIFILSLRIKARGLH